MDGYWPDIKPFFEDVRAPLRGHAIVSHNGCQFRAELWMGATGICYVFVNISNNGYKPFARKPSEVKVLLDTKKIIVEKYL